MLSPRMNCCGLQPEFMGPPAPDPSRRKDARSTAHQRTVCNQPKAVLPDKKLPIMPIRKPESMTKPPGRTQDQNRDLLSLDEVSDDNKTGWQIQLERENEEMKTEIISLKQQIEELKQQNSAQEQRTRFNASYHIPITTKDVRHQDVLFDIKRYFKDVQYKLTDSVNSIPNTQLWQIIVKIFQETFDSLQKEILEKFYKSLHGFLKGDNADNLNVTEAYGHLLDATGMRGGNPPDDIKKKIHLEIQKQTSIPALTSKEQVLLSENLEKTIEIVWKMLTLNPPLLCYQPLKYAEDIHTRHHSSWKVTRVACKALVGNKEPIKEPINYIESSDSEDSDDERFQMACTGNTEETAHSKNQEEAVKCVQERNEGLDVITTAFYYLQVKLIKDICNSCKKLFQESDEVLWYVERGRCYCYHQNCNKEVTE